MAPDGSDRERSPLEPVKDNILPVAGEPPPLELPDPLKGAQAIDDVPEELMQEADPESGDSAETLPSLASSSSSAGTSAGPVLAASDEALVHVPRSQPLAMPMKRDSTGMPTERPEFGLSSSAPAFASSAPAFSFGQPRPASLTVSRNEDDGAASAIQALLTATVTVTVTVILTLTDPNPVHPNPSLLTPTLTRPYWRCNATTRRVARLCHAPGRHCRPRAARR